MNNSYRKYDIAYKNSLIEQYLNEKASTNISEEKFARKHNIAFSTFNRWICTYKKSLMDENTSDNSLVEIVPHSGFVSLSKVEVIDDTDLKAGADSSLKLMINGAQITFDINQLENVISVLKKC